jgi:dihydrofolate reductase
MSARLIYSAICSLDGYVADERGNFEWAVPDDEVHGHVNELIGSIGTHLYGRRLYETMMYWERFELVPTHPPPNRPHEQDVATEFAELWRDADKVVYSRTLSEVSTARTTLERSFDPAAIRRRKRRADRDLLIGGATLAGEALHSDGLVDELHLYLHPVLVGGGTRALPDGVSARLELIDEHRFASGVVHLHHRVGGD